MQTRDTSGKAGEDSGLGQVIQFPSVDWEKQIWNLMDIITKKLDCGFEFTSSFTDEIHSYCHYPTQQIRVMGGHDKLTYVAAVHATGHWVHYLRNMKAKQPPRDRRETMAYLYGWAIIKHFKLPLVRRDWMTAKPGFCR